MIFLKKLLLFSFFALSYISNLNGTEKELQNSLNHWDQVVSQLTTKTPLYDRGEDRLRAYLYHAQRNFVDAVIAKSGQYPTNVDAISLYVIQLFYPNYQEKVDSNFKEINLQIERTIDQRFTDEKANIYPISPQKKENGWVGKMPYHGLEIPNWKPWVLNSASELRLDPPPSDSLFWQNQLHAVKEAMAKTSDSQKQRILFWANMTGIGSGDFVYIINQYMKDAKVPVMKQLKVRDAVGQAIVDATIAVFDMKYTYLVQRPSMVDANLKTYIDTPNHPSFPSAHSTVCFAILEVLQRYLPEHSSEWQRLAEEGGMSRIWGGIHFPADHEAGKKLGKKVGQAILQKTR